MSSNCEKDQRPILEFEGGGSIKLSPIVNLDNVIGGGPSNFDIFIPRGNSSYGFSESNINPFKERPTMEPNGGFIFFDNDVPREDFNALTRILKIGGSDSISHDYVAFLKESKNPKEDGYLTQLRLVSNWALYGFYKCISGYEFKSFPKQELSITDAMFSFIDSQKKTYGTSYEDSQLEGKFGGNGWCAREELNFGLMVENDYYRTYRIWSTAWLVTK